MDFCHCAAVRDVVSDGQYSHGREQSLDLPVLPGSTLIMYLAMERLNPFSWQQQSAGKEVCFPKVS